MKHAKIMQDLESRAPAVEFPTESKPGFATFTEKLKMVVCSNLTVRGWDDFEYDVNEGKYLLKFRFATRILDTRGIFEMQTAIDPRAPLEPQIRELDARILKLVRKLNREYGEQG